MTLAPSTASSHSRRLLLFIAYIGFISLGLPDPLIGVAWPSVRGHFNVPLDAVALVFMGFGLSYVLSSFFTGRLLKICGIGLLLALSSALVAMSGFGFGLAPVWLAFAACALLHGLGSGAIDAGLNHYVAHHFSARHMNWLHACYSLGATFGPLIMTAAITSYGSWRAGYGIVATILLVLALLFTFTRRRWTDGDSASAVQPHEVASVSLGRALRQKGVSFHVVLFFLYVGLEITVGQWSYTVLTESRGLAKQEAGLWVTFYWASIGIGRVLFGFVVDRLGVDLVLRGSMILAAAGAALFVTNLSPLLSCLSLPMMGLGLASIFPCLMTRTPHRLGAAVAAHAIGFQVSAGMLGGAALPSLSGLLAQRIHLETIPVAILVMALSILILHEILLLRLRGATTSHPA